MSRALAGAAAALSLAMLLPGGARAAAPASARYVGTYTLTTVGGAGVRHMELRLAANGNAMLRTESSRDTQRPVAMGVVAPVVESGTWRLRGRRVVVHITRTSDDDPGGGPGQAPTFNDLAFELSGCELRLVTEGSRGGDGLTFDKDRCSG